MKVWNRKHDFSSVIKEEQPNIFLPYVLYIKKQTTSNGIKTVLLIRVIHENKIKKVHIYTHTHHHRYILCI